MNELKVKIYLTKLGGANNLDHDYDCCLISDKNGIIFTDSIKNDKMYFL